MAKSYLSIVHDFSHLKNRVACSWVWLRLTVQFLVWPEPSCHISIRVLFLTNSTAETGSCGSNDNSSVKSQPKLYAPTKLYPELWQPEETIRMKNSSIFTSFYCKMVMSIEHVPHHLSPSPPPGFCGHYLDNVLLGYSSRKARRHFIWNQL